MIAKHDPDERPSAGPRPDDHRLGGHAAAPPGGGNPSGPHPAVHGGPRSRLRVFGAPRVTAASVRPAARQGSQPRTRSPSARHAAAGPTAPRGPQRAEAPDPLPHRGPQDAARRPRPGPVGDLDPDSTVPGNDRDRDRRPGSTRAAMPDSVTEDLADQQDGHIPARMPGTEHLPDESAAARARSARPPGKRRALPDRHPGHHRTRALPLPAPALGSIRAVGRGHTRMHARLRAACQAWTTRPRGRSAAVRETADGANRPSEMCTPTVLTARTPVRHTSVDSAI